MNNAEKTIDMAVSLCQRNFSVEDIENILNGDDDVQKCIAIMGMGNITSQKIADLLLFHLTNHGGTVREAAAIKLTSLFDKEVNIKFFKSDYAINTICDAIIDINPNISRLILDILNKIENKELIQENILNKMNCSLENIFKSEILQNHQINKFYFKIYWLLEALYRLDNLNVEVFNYVFEKIAELPEYTVREKVAQLVKKYDNDFCYLKQKLINDDNYYVRRIFD